MTGRRRGLRCSAPKGMGVCGGAGCRPAHAGQRPAGAAYVARCRERRHIPGGSRWPGCVGIAGEGPMPASAGDLGRGHVAWGRDVSLRVLMRGKCRARVDGRRLRALSARDEAAGRRWSPYFRLGAGWRAWRRMAGCSGQRNENQDAPPRLSTKRECGGVRPGGAKLCWRAEGAGPVSAARRFFCK